MWIFDVILLGALVYSCSTQQTYSGFVKEHNTKPYCIEREVGAATVKKCYIAKEVE